MSSSRRFATILTVSILLLGSAAAQTPTDSAMKPAAAAADTMKEAERLFAAREWGLAIEQYRKVVATDPQNSLAWHHLGYCLHMEGKLDEALVAHKKAAEFPETRGIGNYNIACVYALQGKPDEAFAALEICVDAGFADRGQIDHDDDLKSLRADPRYAALGQRIDAAEKKSAEKRKQVAVLVHEGAELLDFAGPAEVFANANMGGERAFRVFTVAPSAGTVRTQQSVTIVPEFTIANCPKPDIIVIPGGDTDQLTNDKAVMEWIKQASASADVTLTVCTGAFTLANQGLLDGLGATTHFSALPALKRNPKIKVHENVRFVDNGKIITTAGISAGIDGALHVVDRLHGRCAAEQTARYMEYEWRPQK